MSITGELVASKIVYSAAAAGAAIIAIIAIIVAYQSIQSTEGSNTTVQRLLASPTPNVAALGSPDAEITIVEFGDYRCVHCARFNAETKDALISEYVDTGKSRFIFRDFPVNDSPSDRSSAFAAEASYCAAEQGKYWEYHDRIFCNFDFDRKTNMLAKDILESFASDVGIADEDKFSSCLESGKYSSTIEDSLDLARSLGLKGTPAFVIIADGKSPVMIEGFQPIDVFKRELDRLLSVDVN